MFPSFSLFRFASISTQSLLLALGVLAALSTAERLASRLGLRPNLIWNAAVLGGASLVVGERLVLLMRGWRDFLAHPLWMLGLIAVRDQRLFYMGAGLAIAVCAAYLRASRVSLARAADALLPATGLLLAFVQAGYFAAGAEPGRVTANRWGWCLPTARRMRCMERRCMCLCFLLRRTAVWAMRRSRSWLRGKRREGTPVPGSFC